MKWICLLLRLEVNWSVLIASSDSVYYSQRSWTPFWTLAWDSWNRFAQQIQTLWSTHFAPTSTFQEWHGPDINATVFQNGYPTPLGRTHAASGGSNSCCLNDSTWPQLCWDNVKHSQRVPFQHKGHISFSFLECPEEFRLLHECYIIWRYMQVYATETITVSQARIPCSIAPVSESQHLSSKKLPLTKITKDLNLKDVISKSWLVYESTPFGQQ